MKDCPHCQVDRQTLQLFDRGEAVERCAVCGYPWRNRPP